MKTHYTFGDVELAARRLARLAEVFEPSLVNFVTRVVEAGELPRRTGLRVLDLGCGPGWTTRALVRLLSPCSATGVDGSERFLEEARTHSSDSSIGYQLGDVTAIDFAPLAADVVYSRFLLTHLPDPAAALSRWADGLQPGGRMLLQETAVLDSGHPALRRYYELVDILQRRHGQSLHIGCELPTLVDRLRYRVVTFVETPISVSASSMAELHAMNIQTWRHDTAAHDFDRNEVERLTSDLDALARDRDSPARVDYVMGEMVLVLL